MDLRSKVGQLLFVGIDGAEPAAEMGEFLREVRPGGIVLFARNIESAAQVRRLCAFLSRAVDPPPFLSIDQEGGRVNRLLPLVGALPPAATLSSQGGERVVEEFGRQTGRALKALGFTMDFAPCVDLSAPGAGNGIAERAFGDRPEVVERLAGAFLDGLQGEGIAGVIKHFPGLGPTDADTHISFPTSDKPAEQLWEQDLLPFRRLAARAPAIMVAHAHYASFDTDRRSPASLSLAIVGGLLRGRMGYTGVAIPDDLEMGAVCEQAPPEELSVRSLEVGCDMPMFCKSRALIEQAHRGVMRAVETGRLSEERFGQSLSTIRAAKERFGLQPLDEKLPEEDFARARVALRRIAESCAA